MRACWRWVSFSNPKQILRQNHQAWAGPIYVVALLAQEVACCSMHETECSFLWQGCISNVSLQYS